MKVSRGGKKSPENDVPVLCCNEMKMFYVSEYPYSAFCTVSKHESTSMLQAR